MTDVLCFGEALIDMRSETVSGRRVYHPQPGGAPANVAVGVARLGGRSGFLGQVGADVFGTDIMKVLEAYGVDISHTLQTGDAATALAFVTLDDSGERSFAFYRTDTADLRYKSDMCPEEALARARIVHFCSNTLTSPAIRETTFALVRRARAHGCLVSFDVNYRQPLWPVGEMPAPHILRAAAMADIVKFSREELEALFGKDTDLSDELADQGVKLLVVSDGDQPLTAWCQGRALSLQPPAVEAKDTTAAGDSFVAGLLYWLSGQITGSVTLTRWLENPNGLEQALAFAARCGAFTAMHHGAFEALPSAGQLQATVPENT